MGTGLLSSYTAETEDKPIYLTAALPRQIIFVAAICSKVWRTSLPVLGKTKQQNTEYPALPTLRSSAGLATAFRVCS